MGVDNWLNLTDVKYTVRIVLKLRVLSWN